MASTDKPLVWFHGEVKTPPFSVSARRDAGVLLRRLQRGEKLGMPSSRPMPAIGPRCHELRVRDTEAKKQWRVMYRTDADAVVIIDVLQKTTRETPRHVLDTCRQRLAQYDRLAKGGQ